MMRILKTYIHYLFLIIALLSYKHTVAQTPITDITFWEVYAKDYNIVSVAADTGVLTDEIAAFLLNDNVTNDLKAAIINALSFDLEEKYNSIEFLKKLKIKKGLSPDDYLPLDSMNASELFCYAYLKLMDNYFEYQSMIPVFKLALEKDPRDCAINFGYTLVTMQYDFWQRRCQAVTSLQLFLNSFDYFVSPFFPGVRKLLEKYYKQIKEGCTE